jgi:hypothetical protein
MSTRWRTGQARQPFNTTDSMRVTDEVMISLRAPVSREKIERWVEEQVGQLRDAAWSRGVRLGPLWRGWRSQGPDWLIEVDLRDRAVELEDDLVLGSVLLDMELLGLRPQLLVSPPRERPGPADVHALAAQAPVRRGGG